MSNKTVLKIMTAVVVLHIIGFLVFFFSREPAVVIAREQVLAEFLKQNCWQVTFHLPDQPAENQPELCGEVKQQTLQTYFLPVSGEFREGASAQPAVDVSVRLQTPESPMTFTIGQDWAMAVWQGTDETEKVSLHFQLPADNQLLQKITEQVTAIPTETEPAGNQ